MKQFSLLLLAAIFILYCKNKNQLTHTKKNADGTTTTTSVDVASLTCNTDEMSKKMQALKKMKPLTLDQLKALLPAEINGIQRSIAIIFLCSIFILASTVKLILPDHI